MRWRTVIVSAVLHVLVFGLALKISANKAAHRRTSVAVVGEKKKAEKKKEEDKPKPKPKPQVVASARPEITHSAPVKAAPVEAATPQPSEAPVETGLTLGNSDGPGIDVGGPVKPAQPKGPQAGQQAGAQKGAAAKKDKVLAPKDNPEEDNCTEAPSKPVPVTRSSDIEYTQEARANGVEGRLVLKITIGADGSVSNVEVVSGVDAALDAAAIAAVKTWVFKPSMRCGKAMGGGVFTLARRFELGD